MVRHRYKRKRPPGYEVRSKGFERMNAKLGFDQLAHEAALRRRDGSKSDSSLLPGYQTQKQREQKAMKLARKVQGLERDLVEAKNSPGLIKHEGVYFMAYDRYMPITYLNEAYKLCQTRLFLTRQELLSIINNPQVFPNPCLVYSLFDQKYRIEWDGKK